MFSAYLAIATAPPPPNDNCDNAIPLTPASFPFLTEPIYDLSGATSVGDPEFECSLFRAPTNSVWYTFTPENSGTYALSTADGTVTFTNLDTVLGVYEVTNGCAAVEDFVLVNCNNDVGDELRAKLFATLTAGTTYYIYVALFETYTYEGGTNTVQLLIDLISPPANDFCSSAEVIPTDAAFPYRTAIHDIAGATTNGSPVTVPACQESAVRSVWFTFRPSADAEYDFSTCSELTETLVTDTVLALYSAPNGCDGTLTEVACNDDDETSTCQEENLQSYISAFLNHDTDYYIVIWQWYDPEFTVIDEVHPGDSLVQLYVNSDYVPPIAVAIRPAKEGAYVLDFAGMEGLQVRSSRFVRDLIGPPKLGSCRHVGE